MAGAAAGSQTVGVGMSVAINDVNRDTQALIGQRRDDATPVAGAGSFSAGKLLIGSENKGFIGNLAVSGSRVSSPVAGAGDGTGAGGGGTSGGGTDVLAPRRRPARAARRRARTARRRIPTSCCRCRTS